MDRRTFARGSIAAVLAAFALVAAAGEIAFSRPAFDKAVAAGSPVILAVHATRGAPPARRKSRSWTR